MFVRKCNEDDIILNNKTEQVITRSSFTFCIHTSSKQQTQELFNFKYCPQMHSVNVHEDY